MSFYGDHEAVDLTSFKLKRSVIQQLDEAFCRDRQVGLLGMQPAQAGDVVPLGMLNPFDDDSAHEVGQCLQCKVRRIQLNAFEIDRVLVHGFAPSSSEAAMTVDAGRERLDLSFDSHVRFERDQRVPEMVVDALSEAVRAGATDVHIESYSHDVDLRYRIDGVMHHRQTPLSPANLPHVLNYLKVLCGLDITERRHAQDGRIETFYIDEKQQTRRIDLRTTFCPGPWGEDVVLRILDERRIDMKLEQLGMPDDVAEPFRQALHRPSGVLLVTGPTGSGKTTTLYASIRTINTPENKILSVEDPIEYVLPKVNQKERTAHMDFADFGRAFMRQNPDVLMIGEVRDAETAQVVLQAAQTGHLVLSTLHTLRAAGAVERLMTLGSDPGLAASALLGVLNQRLVRRVCAACAEPYDPDPEVLKRLPALPAGTLFRHGIGCANCHEVGCRGMVGVFEFLPMDMQRRETLRMTGRLTAEDLADCRTLWDDAMHKVTQGATTVEEVLRVLSVPDF